MTPIRPIAAGCAVLCALTAHADTITIRAEPSKAAVQPGEVFQIKVFAKLDPGIGGATIWYPPNGGPPKDATVAALLLSTFGMRVTGNTVTWFDIEKNPELQWFQGQIPVPHPFGLLGISAYNPKGPYVATDNWLFTATLMFNEAKLGSATFFDPLDLGVQAVLVDAPGEPEFKLQIWEGIQTPLVMQIVPAPGTLGVIALVFMGLGRRKR